MTFFVKNDIIYIYIIFRREDIKINRGINDFLEHDIDFTNYDVVRNVILNKQIIIEAVKYQQRSKFLSFENREFDIELVDYVENIYSKLDKYIEVCNLNKKNTKLINMLFEGFNIEEVARELKIKNKAVFNRVRRVTIKINSLAMKEKRKDNEIKTT